MTLEGKQLKGDLVIFIVNICISYLFFYFFKFRCLSVVDPVKGETKSSESWQTFLFRLRQALMAAFSRTLTKFEETVRTQRERRNELNWNFCNYFLLQVYVT